MVKVINKADKDAAPVHYPWEAAMDALRSEGDFDIMGYEKKEDRGPDQPGAQSPAPGTHPVDGPEEFAADGNILTNITGTEPPAGTRRKDVRTERVQEAPKTEGAQPQARPLPPRSSDTK